MQGADIRTVLRSISEFSKVNIIPDREVAGPISVRLVDVPWHQALTLVCQSAGLEAVENKDVIRVATSRTLIEEELEGEANARKREDLLQATERVLGKIAREVARRTKTPLSGQQIGVKVGKVINRFKMAKHIKLDIQDGSFSWERKEVSIKRENELDGIYVIRTSESKEDLGAEDTVRTYKRLTLVERAFRCLKGVDLRVRPIWLRLEHHVRAHIFLCMLAYYVDLHMRKAWAPLLFHDEELDEYYISVVLTDQHGPVAEHIQLIKKPFRKAALAQTVRAILDHPVQCW